ncbi:probable integral membrane protein [Mycobacterium leprae]|uniref:DUF5134 domain-containing protein n=3 Tax=Mycobacterium leprae TaxID=1769 RepID=A0AAD0P5A2_MYCLR|nr:DUF5134 domain-containing protein [Mycobacterium leprae]CAR72094.1 probable integral membrane protein [Mycobacterium leprae Br4923]AWV48395.1 DUF5134 domain-containing protein [Mycobacterium leprae]OAR20807.1 DUF5134 domain-containing protein [Mycobacterium leprae 3125609]OAX72010.1 DUF5134 domain-containing protein [Mycobacterium leprae 7935681]CAC30952.1 probable integral membrane protein [Mycobacterium leprae]
MIDDLLLRWVVTGLFVLSAAECGFACLACRRPWTLVPSNGLHFAMAIAMAVMAWPRGAQLPTTGTVVFCGLVGAWFVILATVSSRRIAERAAYAYPALMMLAMVWMYVIMDSHLHDHWATGHHTSPHTSMLGVDMTTTVVPASGIPGWISIINWLWFAFFCIATVFWTYRSFATSRRNAGFSRYCSLHPSGQAMMSTGMAIMFGVLLFHV